MRIAAMRRSLTFTLVWGMLLASPAVFVTTHASAGEDPAIVVTRVNHYPAKPGALENISIIFKVGEVMCRVEADVHPMENGVTRLSHVFIAPLGGVLDQSVVNKTGGLSNLLKALGPEFTSRGIGSTGIVYVEGELRSGEFREPLTAPKGGIFAFPEPEYREAHKTPPMYFDLKAGKRLRRPSGPTLFGGLLGIHPEMFRDPAIIDATARARAFVGRSIGGLGRGIVRLGRTAGDGSARFTIGLQSRWSSFSQRFPASSTMLQMFGPALAEGALDAVDAETDRAISRRLPWHNNYGLPPSPAGTGPSAVDQMWADLDRRANFAWSHRLEEFTYPDGSKRRIYMDMYNDISRGMMDMSPVMNAEPPSYWDYFFRTKAISVPVVPDNVAEDTTGVTF